MLGAALCFIRRHGRRHRKRSALTQPLLDDESAAHGRGSENRGSFVEMSARTAFEPQSDKALEHLEDEAIANMFHNRTAMAAIAKANGGGAGRRKKRGGSQKKKKQSSLRFDV